MTIPIARLHARLPDNWIEIAKAEAKERHSSNREAGVVNAKIGAQGDAETDYIGVCGEMGYSLIFGVQRDETICPRHGSIDFIMPGGIKTEVKATHYVKKGHLIAAAKELQANKMPKGHPYITGSKGSLIGVHEPADHYALMLIDTDKNEAIYAGYATFEQLINEKCIKRMRSDYDESFALHQSKLTTLDMPRMHQLAEAAQDRGDQVRIVVDLSRIAYA